MTVMLTPLQRAQDLARNHHPRRKSAQDDFVIGSQGLQRHEIPETLRLFDVTGQQLPKASTASRREKTPPATDTAKGFLDKPITLRRAWAWKAALASPFVLLLGAAMADKYTGGEVMLGVVDASIATTDYAYKHLYGKIDPRDAIEWGIKTARALEVFHTDPNGLLAKNEAAIMAKKKFHGLNFMVKENVLPVVFTVDMERFLGNYALRNAIALRNYPGMKTQVRGKILAQGLLADVHKSYEAASELKDVPLTDRDILTFFERRPEIVKKMPSDLQTGLKEMITDLRKAENRLPGQSGITNKPVVLQEWQKRVLEEGLAAEGVRAPTAEEVRRSDAEMARALKEQADAMRPRTIGELLKEQHAKQAPKPGLR